MLTMAQHYKHEASTEILRELAYQLSCKLRVALPGIIQSFDGDHTVTVKVAVREKVKVNDSVVSEEIPLLVDVPIVLPRVQNFVLTMPIQPGDECLLLVSDVCIDSWLTRGGVQNQTELRRHDFSDAFALIGIWSKPHAIQNYSATAAELRSMDGTSKVSVQDHEVIVSAPQVTVTAPTVNVTATSQVNISGAGNVEIDGKNFLTHKHIGVSSGGGVSGPVQ